MRSSKNRSGTPDSFEVIPKGFYSTTLSLALQLETALAMEQRKESNIKKDEGSQGLQSLFRGKQRLRSLSRSLSRSVSRSRFTRNAFSEPARNDDCQRQSAPHEGIKFTIRTDDEGSRAQPRHSEANLTGNKQTRRFPSLFRGRKMMRSLSRSFSKSDSTRMQPRDDDSSSRGSDTLDTLSQEDSLEMNPVEMYVNGVLSFAPKPEEVDYEEDDAKEADEEHETMWRPAREAREDIQEAKYEETIETIEEQEGQEAVWTDEVESILPSAAETRTHKCIVLLGRSGCPITSVCF